MSDDLFPTSPEPVELAPRRARRNPIPVLAVIAAVLLVAGIAGWVALSDRGTDDSASKRFAAVPAAVLGAGSFSYEVDVAADAGDESTSMTFSGAVDPATGRASMDLGALIPGAKIVTDGTYAYLPVPESARRNTDGKPFVRFDAATLGSLGAGSGMGSTMNPMETLSLLESVGSDIERVGDEKVRGVDSTHYRTTVDLTRAMPADAATDPGVAAALGQFRKVPTDVWLDNQGRPVRYVNTLSIDTGGAAGRVSSKVTLELFDYGMAAAVQLPAADQVFDTDPASALGLLVGPQLSALVPRATS